MYAVIQTGGKQYRVAQGSTLRVEKLDADEGASVELDRVLMITDGDDVQVGTPYRFELVTVPIRELTDEQLVRFGAARRCLG